MSRALCHLNWSFRSRSLEECGDGKSGGDSSSEVVFEGSEKAGLKAKRRHDRG